MPTQEPAAANGPSDPLLDVRGVTKHFAGVTALDSVSFELGAGEVRALVGENGAGKSTLIKVFTGVYRPDAGEVRYLGAPVAFANPREAQVAGISTIYQEINLVPQMSAARNLFLGREPRNRLGLIDVRRMNTDASDVLARYGVHVDPRKPLRELGVGVQQMVAIARAVTTEARVVVMDEPTSSLEPREVERLFEVIRLLREQQVGVVYVSHKLDEIFTICDSVTVLRDGRRVHEGPVPELTKLHLVAVMLGRDVADVRASGKTRFTDSHVQAAEPVLSARSLARRHLLEDVDVDVRPGEVVGLAGLLGSGRSETVKAIFGAQAVDRGAISVGGTPVKTGSPARALAAGIALLPEDRKAEGIVPDLSIRENILLATLPRLTRAGFVSDRKGDEIVEIFMRRLRIKAAGPQQKVRELSGGNQQKVLLARLLCLHPKVLLLDEPTRGIDVGAKAEVQALIDELAETGLGVVLISSELEELAEGSDRVLVLHEGRVVSRLDDEAISEEEIMAAIAADHDEPAERPEP
jgi:ribose transport system ATP-binding protein